MGIVILLIQLAILVAIIAGIWKVFTKAGHPGWAAIVPIYNIYILTQMTNKPAWWVVLFFIPLVNLIAAVIISIELAARFGKSTGYGIGLALLGFVFYPMLGFSDAVYQAASESEQTEHSHSPHPQV